MTRRNDVVVVGGGVCGVCGFGDGGGASLVGAAASSAMWLVVVSIIEGKNKPMPNQCPMPWLNVSNSLNNSDQRRTWVRM